MAFQFNPERAVFLEGHINGELIEKIRQRTIELWKDSRETMVDLFINTNGGQDLQSFGYIEFVRRILKLPTRTICNHEASSNGVPLFMLGTERLMSKESMLFMHLCQRNNGDFPYSTVEMQVATATMEQEDLLYRRAILEAPGIDEAKLNDAKLVEMMHNPRFITAQEAVDLTLATGIIE